MIFVGLDDGAIIGNSLKNLRNKNRLICRSKSKIMKKWKKDFLLETIELEKKVVD